MTPPWLAPTEESPPSAQMTPPVTATIIRNLIQSAPPPDQTTMLRRWVEDARLTAVEPDVGGVESYLWAAELSKLHGAANWQALRGALNARLLRARGDANDAWQSLLLAQVVHAMQFQWTEDEQHLKTIRKWVGQAPNANAFKEAHLTILRNMVAPEVYLSTM